MAEGDHIVFSFTPGFRDGAGWFFESETEPDPFLAGEPEIAGLLAGSRRFLST